MLICQQSYGPYDGCEKTRLIHLYLYKNGLVVQILIIHPPCSNVETK